MKNFGAPTCNDCNKKLANSLTKEQEEELTATLIEALKKYPISYAEAYRVLECVESKLNAMSKNLRL